MSRPVVKPIVPILFAAATSAFAYSASYAQADGPANPETYDSEIVAEQDSGVDGGMPTLAYDAGMYVAPPVMVPPVETDHAIEEGIPAPPGRRRTTTISQPHVTILTENLPDYVPGQPWAARVLVEASEGAQYDCTLGRKSTKRLTGINPTHLRGSDNELIGCSLEATANNGIKYGILGESSTDVTLGHQYDLVLNLMPADKKNRFAKPLATKTYHLNVVAAPEKLVPVVVGVSAVEAGQMAVPGSQGADVSVVPLLEVIIDNEGPTFEVRIEPTAPTSNDTITIYSAATDKSGITDHSLVVNVTLVSESGPNHYFKSCDTSTTCTERIGPLIAGTVIDYRSFAKDTQRNVGESNIATITIVAAPVEAPVGAEVPAVVGAKAPTEPATPIAEHLPTQSQLPVADDLSAHVDTSATSPSAWTFEAGAGARYVSTMPNAMPEVRLHVGRQIVDGLSVVAGADIRYGQRRDTSSPVTVNPPTDSTELLVCEGESSCNTPLYRVQHDVSTTNARVRDTITQYGGPTVGLQYDPVSVGSDSTLGLFAEGTVDVQKEHVRTDAHTNITRHVLYTRGGAVVREMDLGPEEMPSDSNSRTIWFGALETTLGPVLRIGAGDGYVVVRGGVTYDFRNDSVGGMLQVGYQFDREDREAKK